MFIDILAHELKKRDNPGDLKEGFFAKVEQIAPIILSCENGKILLRENNELYISEWFRFRCNIDKTTALSAGVVSDLNSGKAVKETHSYTGASCNMPSAINYLASAITKINNELLALKCNLKKGDRVVVMPLNMIDKYILVDKILEE